MELLRAYKQTEVWFHELTDPHNFPTTFDTDFALMLWANEPAVSREVRNALCDQIVQTKCYYAVCGGESCEIWHDTIDEAHVMSDPNFRPPDEKFMMTSWHDQEPPSEVFWFLLHCTNYLEERGPAPEIQRFLILFVGTNESAKLEIVAAMNKEIDERAALDKLVGEN